MANSDTIPLTMLRPLTPGTANAHTQVMMTFRLDQPFFGIRITIAHFDPFQDVTTNARGVIMGDTMESDPQDCGSLMPLSRVAARIDEYLDAE